MRIVGVHINASDDNPIRFDLSCGHVVRGKLPPLLDSGDEYNCPECDTTERRKDWQPATPEELERVAAEYRIYMEGMGVVFPTEAAEPLVRMARIQDAWRLAFKRVLG